jgi:hypothetical protein
VIYGDLVGSTNKHSFNNKVKLRVMWSMWKQFTSEHISYREYSESFASNEKISIRSEIKKCISKK